ncbi:MAG: ArsR family transcriptional regulator [Saprospiraceae bacterium]|nr:ArsR family transcriptional regulator [Saprospiraceae bacterium]MCB0624743.1 ArsR family transcriptional regulator [Saprospiraceae bacterium]MCB0675699.1 ArsR family transcriptional regulator [Saprospiraceae bacterium]MCB0681240.1 ArsR family transcriptional regulator [Saprospiraceae bacterium]
MIETLISSKTRIKLLLKFFLNSKTTAYLRGLEGEFGESSNAIRLELNRLEKAGMLKAQLKGNKKLFRANTAHPLFEEIHKILLKHIGLDRIVENVIERLGAVRKVYLAGKFASGIDSPVIDLIFIGDVDKEYLIKLIERAEELINRKIRYLIYTEEEIEDLDWSTIGSEPLLLWSKD